MSLKNYNLLIIDLGIRDLDILINSINDTTCYILLDPVNDTFDSLLNKITNLDISNLIYVGLIREEYYGVTYTLVNSQVTPSTLENIEILDPTLDTWSEIFNFFRTLQTNYRFIELDWISCELASYPDYVYIFNYFSRTFNISIGASTNLIGNFDYGGSWIETTNNSNLQDIYFNSNILNYPDTFALITTSITLGFSSKSIIYGKYS
jgi:hypothetical protein